MNELRQDRTGRYWQIALLIGTLLIAICSQPSLAQNRGAGKGGGGGNGGGGGDGGGHVETAGNNLSFPVIWAEGVTKSLRGESGMTPQLKGEWWYWWGTEGTDQNIVPLSGPPDPDDKNYLDDGIPGHVTEGLEVPFDEPALVKAYLQKDEDNQWQAGSADWSSAPVEVNWIDWGDNLESVDWYLRSQVRTEVVLFQDLAIPMLEYDMRHVDGWGIDEVHGIAADLSDVEILGPGNQATVFSPCARLTIQKLTVARELIEPGMLVWIPEQGWTEAESVPPELELIDPPIFNMAVHEAGDGPGFYNAEVNVKGRIIYGYTWNVRKLNDGPGDYRITFSFDNLDGFLNTFFVEGTTQILIPLEEELLAALIAESEETEGGGVPVLDAIDPVTGEGNNLTYIDIRIHERSGGRK